MALEKIVVDINEKRKYLYIFSPSCHCCRSCPLARSTLSRTTDRKDGDTDSKHCVRLLRSAGVTKVSETRTISPSTFLLGGSDSMKKEKHHEGKSEPRTRGGRGQSAFDLLRVWL